MTTGKFSDELCEKLYELSLDGGADGEYEFGSVTEGPGRWWGLMLNIGQAELDIRDAPDGLYFPLHVILTEDSQGFVDYATYETAEEAQAEFDRIVADVSVEMHEYHDELDDECSLCEEMEG